MNQRAREDGLPNGSARQESGVESSCAPLRRPVVIVNPRGLHPRIITLFTARAKQYSSDVVLWNGELRADGKSVMDLILLMAMPGAEVVLEVSGPDADAALGPLAEILGAEGGEDFDPDGLVGNGGGI